MEHESTAKRSGTRFVVYFSGGHQHRLQFGPGFLVAEDDSRNGAEIRGQQATLLSRAESLSLVFTFSVKNQAQDFLPRRALSLKPDEVVFFRETHCARYRICTMALKHHREWHCSGVRQRAKSLVHERRAPLPLVGVTALLHQTLCNKGSLRDGLPAEDQPT